MNSAKIICDSINPSGDRLTTFIVTFPRYILAELATHRMFSKNSASSRAIPINKMIWSVIKEPVIPIKFGQNGKGMQDHGELPSGKRILAKYTWLISGWFACLFCWILSKIGVHKQISNRLIEPYSHITVLITATEWGNFFNLRCHPAAHPDMQELAYNMLEAYIKSEPKKLKWGEWHIPFSDKHNEDLSKEDLIKVCTARAARLSYLTFDGKFSPEKDYKLHDDLIRDGHFSPTEHAAQAEYEFEVNRFGESTTSFHKNFKGFKQYREFLPLENRKEFDTQNLLSKRPNNEKNNLG